MSRLPRAPGDVLAAAGLEAAAEAERARPAERVHAARVASKRLRSYWRLLSRAVGADVARRRRRDLSRAARFLADARERDALRALARDLARSEKGLAGPLAAFLRRLPPPEEPSSLKRKLGLAAAKLHSSARALAREGRRARRAEVRKRLKALKRKLARSRERARRRGEAADLHVCRKRAKDLKYILDALEISAPTARAYGKAADELGEARDLRTLASKARLGGRLEERARKLEAAGLARL